MTKKSAFEIGQVMPSRTSGDFMLIDYRVRENKRGEFLIRFLDTQMELWANLNAIRAGNVRDPYARTVCGIGYLGVGRFTAYLSGSHVVTPQYRLWSGMLNRVYNPKNPRYERYKDCRVSSRWQCFQHFAQDVTSMANFDRPGFELDKDLLFPHLRLYSKKTCVFLPKEINGWLTKATVTKVGRNKGLPPGVERARNGTDHRYIGLINYKEKRKQVGTFSTPEDAVAALRTHRLKHSRLLAIKYKDALSPEVIAKLKNFSGYD